ncbi:hypothetical protein MIND_00838400 [Mycena indigotica]|uniref:Uncharacterized protein n=1 Tax=Mycena indigotica TaxID=2126181 RepID=A0A8H6VYK1_9AGAR|nr:uncharacterized protein MIND_00838400 [Mycena indigotica]KAF7298904.1 hypothetical protein MIND_00838400 [Mycena indigotica]
MVSTSQTTARAQQLCLELAAAPSDVQDVAIAMGELFLVVENSTIHRKSAVSLVTSASAVLVPVLEIAQKGGLPSGNAELQNYFQDMRRTVLLMRRLVEDPPRFMFRRSRDSRRLELQLRQTCKAILKQTTHKPPLPTAKAKTILEAVVFGAQIAVAVCDAPILSVFKPIANVVELFNNRAIVAKTNQEAAIMLAQHAENVKANVLKQALLAGEGSESTNILQDSLQEATSLIQDLSARGQLAAWFSAASDSVRFATANAKLAKALDVYTAKEAVETKALLRKSAAEVGQLVATINLDQKKPQPTTSITITVANPTP